MNQEPTQWLTPSQAAKRLGVSATTIREWCKARKIEHKREGERGRGKLGAILIEQRIIDAHNAAQIIPACQPRRADYSRCGRKPFVSPHLSPEKFNRDRSKNSAA